MFFLIISSGVGVSKKDGDYFSCLRRARCCGFLRYAEGTTLPAWQLRMKKQVVFVGREGRLVGCLCRGSAEGLE